MGNPDYKNFVILQIKTVVRIVPFMTPNVHNVIRRQKDLNCMNESQSILSCRQIVRINSE